MAASDLARPLAPPGMTAAPTDEAGSYRRILASTLVIGGASVVSVVIGLVRTKLVALLLGPAGIGLIGLYAGLMMTAATIAQLGLATVGTREIAEAHGAGDARSLAVARRALAIASFALALAGGLAVWLMRAPLAELATGEPGHAAAVGWLAPGVALTVLAGAQSALVRGLQRMADLAWITIIGAVAATIVGVPLLWLLGEAGIGVFVLLGPLTAWGAGAWFVARIPRSQQVQATFADLRPHWARCLRLGVPFMAAGVVGTAVEFWMRIDVHRQLGIDALGQFQASWIIAAQCVGFVLGAMAADYFPRLSAAIREPGQAVTIVNQQTEVALLLSVPAIVAMIGFAPEVVGLLYTEDFSPAAVMLQWQAAALVLKVIGWSLGFVMLAAGDGRAFFLAEATTLAMMAGLLHALIGRHGLAGAGAAYLAGYSFLVLVNLWFARRRLGFRWAPRMVGEITAAILLTSGLFLAIQLQPDLRHGYAAACFAISAAYSTYRLAQTGLWSALRAMKA